MSMLSLIITAYNVGPWIDQALHSAAQVLRPGDELIVIDDASHDDGPARIRSFSAEGPLAPGVRFLPILLGRNTPGGVGSAANIGLDAARGEIVAFLDGDDWLDVAGFDAARRQFEAALQDTVPADLLIANYLEHHEAEGRFQTPSDVWRWSTLPVSETRGVAAAQALALNAVPWRKLYRSAFLDRHHIRFPEGDFFFEDNPFHWSVCRKAGRVLLLDRVVCHHRVARPGQTMEAHGTELLAFFTHYETITAELHRRDRDMRVRAMQWLTLNLCWHMERLRPEAIGAWVASAQHAIAPFPRRDWYRAILPELDAWAQDLLELIRSGQATQAEQRLLGMAIGRAHMHLEARIAEQRQEIDTLRARLEKIAPPVASSKSAPAALAAFRHLREAVLRNKF